jgi:hypothetical protein
MLERKEQIDEVQVEVGRETREGYRTEMIRFTAEKRDWYVDDPLLPWQAGEAIAGNQDFESCTFSARSPARRSDPGLRLPKTPRDAL